MILGIECTAHTFGIGIVSNGKILTNVRKMYTTKSGGIIPMDSAKHHKKIAEDVYNKAIKEAGIEEKKIKAIAFSNAPGLAPCLIEGMKFAKSLAKRLGSLQSRTQFSNSETTFEQVSSLTKKVKAKNLTKSILKQGNGREKRDKFVFENIPLIPVNHCIAHLEIGRLTGAKDPVMLYVSGANTQIIAYEAGKYRIFGETLDLGVGNFIDNFARLLGIGFPGGPKIEELAKKSKNYIELPYTVKGMDIALSGILTNLKQKIEGMNLHSSKTRDIDKEILLKSQNLKEVVNGDNKPKKSRAERVNYSINDLCYSMQETVFAMLIETAERALAHTGKKELLLGGGVACNSRLQEMAKIMCEERGCKLFVPPNSLLVDNGAFIAYLGEIMFESGIKQKPDKVDINARQRTDDVEVTWKK